MRPCGGKPAVFGMEVTRKNYEDSQQAISDAISQCDFISIDGEFTGIDNGQHCSSHPFDTPEERYQKIRRGALEMLMVQFGLCTFRYDTSKNRYEVRPFNFYIFPRPIFKQSPDIRFLCQSSSIDFLCSHDFDFNKVFREGIPYLSASQEQTLRDSLQLRHQQATHFSSPAFTTPDGPDHVIKGPISVPDEHRDFITDVSSRISSFLDETKKDTLELEPCSGYQRKLIYQVIKSRFTTGIHLETKTGKKKERFILVTRVKSEEDFKKMEADKKSAELAELEQAIGFSKVMRMVSQSGKLIVGHNMLLDLVHTLHQFYFPLPEDYTDFKYMTRSIFPRLLDTKLMATTHPFKDKITGTTLGELQKILEQEPFSKPDTMNMEGFSSYCENSGRLHEAGYDAYITGLCFISMSNFLGTFQDPPKKRIPPSSPLIEPFINKLFLMRVTDIPYMNLAGTDLQPCRDHVFHVTFPKEWKTTDLLQLFSPFGNVQVSWINETSAFAALFKKHQADSVLDQLGHGETYKITTYESFKMRETPTDTPSKKRSLPAADIELPSKKRKSIGSDVSYPSRSITPILEEEEEVETPPDMEAETSEGATKAKKAKLFDEPDSW